VKKHLAILLVILFIFKPVFADISGAPALIYDSNGTPLNSTTNALNTFITNSPLAVSQSGTWTVGRTWTLSSGTDSVSVGNFPATQAVTQSTSPWIVAGGGTAGTPATGVVTVQGIAGGTTVPVSGTVSATQSGTWTVQPGNTANTTAWLVTGTGGTFPVTQSTSPWVVNETQIGGSAYSLGQKTMANSAPVVIASDQSAIPVTPSNPSISTYVAVAVAIAPAASATDIFTITGSGTKVVRIYKVRVLGSKSNPAAVVTMNLIKRSTLDTGGTSAAITPVSMDSSDGAATAVVSSYSANPTSLGTSLGIVSPNPTFVPNSVAELFQALFGDFGMRKPITLENANENVALNLSGTTVSGGSITIEVTWTEQ